TTCGRKSASPPGRERPRGGTRLLGLHLDPVVQVPEALVGVGIRSFFGRAVEQAELEEGGTLLQRRPGCRVVAGDSHLTVDSELLDLPLAVANHPFGMAVVPGLGDAAGALLGSEILSRAGDAAALLERHP